MKRIWIMAAAALLSYGAAAQTTQGRFALTGVASYSKGSGAGDREINGKTFTTSGFSYTFSPSIGYFVKDNLLIGASMHYENSESRSESPTTFSTIINKQERERDEYRVFARRYKFLTERFALQATLAGGIGSSNQYNSAEHDDPRFTDSYTRSRSKIGSVSLSPGIVFFPSNRLALTANLGALRYEHNASWHKYHIIPINERDIQDNRLTANSFGFDLSSWNMNFGLSVLIGK